VVRLLGRDKVDSVEEVDDVELDIQQGAVEAYAETELQVTAELIAHGRKSIAGKRARWEAESKAWARVGAAQQNGHDQHVPARPKAPAPAKRRLARVAGMHTLKELMLRDVVEPLRNAESSALRPLNS
jgi:hypothetical protein